VEPELIGTFSAIGSDGPHYTIQCWMTFHLIDGDMHDRRRRWIPDAFPALFTEDRQEVYAINEEEERFGIAGSQVILFPAGSTAEVLAEFASRRKERMSRPAYVG